jgi:outer membrane receptor protein involved in Fe transport
MVSPRKTTYAGLNTFNPQPVTPDIKNHNILASASDQLVSDGGVLDTRVSVKQFDSTIYPSQGSGPMVLAPDVNSGSYFNDQDRTSRRVEWLTTYAFSPLGPMHLVKIGAGVTYETFDGVNRSRLVEIVRENGTLSQAIAFTGDGLLNRHRTALRGFGQDSWTVSPRLTLQFGGRYDYDSFTGDINVAPRASFTAAVSEDGRTVIRGGGGVFYDQIPLNVASFDQMQERATASFEADGVTPAGPVVLMQNAVAALHTPRSINWTLEIDREWFRNFFVRVGYQRRDQRFEPVLNPITPAGGVPELLLATDGQSRYREGQVTARYQFHGADQIVASYTRSSATGNLNDFNTYFGNIENPVIRPDAQGPLPWDAPNRYLFWSNVSLPQGFIVFPVLDVRTGFPLSVVDEDRNFVGPRNEAGRYPTFVSLDLQVSKRLRLFHHNATIGLKVFNITDHFNPRDYQGNLASADFGGFANGVGRTFRGKWVFEF